MSQPWQNLMLQLCYRVLLVIACIINIVYNVSTINKKVEAHIMRLASYDLYDFGVRLLHYFHHYQRISLSVNTFNLIAEDFIFGKKFTPLYMRGYGDIRAIDILNMDYEQILKIANYYGIHKGFLILPAQAQFHTFCFWLNHAIDCYNTFVLRYGDPEANSTSEELTIED